MSEDRVLITGGAGFIGSNLVEKILTHMPDCIVVVVDNFQTGSLDNLTQNPRLKVLELDVNSINHAQKIAAAHGPFKYIFNLACPASPVQYQKDPIHTTMTSINGMLFCCEVAEFQKLIDGTTPRIIHASTSEIYGDPLVHPQPETYFGNVNTLGPRACYDEGKRVAETLASDYIKQRGLNIGIVRIFNTYGPNMATDDGRVISNFICAALRKEPIQINGDGEQTRSFCYIDDLVYGLLKFAVTNHSGPINLGNPREFTINQLAELVAEKIGNTTIGYTPALQDDPKQRKPDISLARAILEWEPEVRLEDGLERTIAYFRTKV